jgi:hypothetical protein
MNSTNGCLEIVEDVKEECSKYGSVEEMKVPRPSGGSRQSNGVGKIYVKYDNNESASKALRALAGRKFADRTVVVTFFAEVRYHPIIHSNLTFTDPCFRNTLMLTHGKLTNNLIRGRYWQSCNVLCLETFWAWKKQIFRCTIGGIRATQS